jgi:hypothetical protein
MKRFLALLVGGLGFGAFARRRRKAPPAELGPDPAVELRAKLAESKTAVSEPEPVTPAVPAEVEESPLDPQARRRDVHERARGAIDDLL